MVPTVLLGQFPVGWINDYLDLENDKAAGRKDKPLATGQIKPRTVLVLASISLTMSVILGFLYNPMAGLVNVVALTSALLYDIKLKGTVFSIVTYIVSFSLLPVFVSLGLDDPKFPGLWIVIAFAFLGTGVHFLNVIPDFIDDAKTGVKGLVHYFSKPTALYLSANFMILSTFIVGFRLRDKTPTLNLIVGFLDIVLLTVLTSYLYTKDYAKAYRCLMH